ncbi:MAG: hypothetical protein HY822_25245 [Acidobacteria bacterium]|nr:hypothetical protein [Acidobacteriota bacterium]
MVWRGVVLAVLLVAVAWAAGIDGKWKAEYTSPDGQARQTTFTFKVEGEKLSGTAAGGAGEAPIQEGKVSGNQISFVVVRNFGGEDVKFNYKGTAAGDEIKLTVNVAAMDRTFEMTAKRIN